MNIIQKENRIPSANEKLPPIDKPPRIDSAKDKTPYSRLNQTKGSSKLQKLDEQTSNTQLRGVGQDDPASELRSENDFGGQFGDDDMI